MIVKAASRADGEPTGRKGPALRALLLLSALALASCAPSPEELWAKAQASLRAGRYAEASIHLKNLVARTPNDAAARAALGSTELALGDAVSAEKELRRALSLGGEGVGSRALLVEALLAQERYGDALAELGSFDAAGSPPMRSLMLAGRAHEGLRQLPEAELRYRQAMDAVPSDPAPISRMAALCLATGRIPEAEALLARALALDDQFVPALLLRGRRVFETRGPAEAESFFRDVAGKAHTPAEQAEALVSLAEVQLVRENPATADETVRRLEAIAPGLVPTLYLRARVQAQSGQRAEAIHSLQRIMNKAPGFLPAERLLGTLHYLDGNLEQAAMHIARVVGEGPGDPFMTRLLAELRLQQDRPEQALQTLLPMIRQSPGAAFEKGLLALAGQASLRLGDNASALDFFRRGSREYPDDLSFRFGEISARLASGDVATARTMLDSMRASTSNALAVDYLSVMAYLVERDFTNAQALASRLAAANADASWAHLLLATVHVAAGDSGSAREEFETVLRLEPGSREALINLARLDYQGGDTAAGERRLRQVIEQHPEDARPLLLLGEAQLAAGRFGEALERARQATHLAPDSPASLNLLGRAAAAAGRWDEARESFTRITALDPRNARAWLNLARATVAAGRSQALPESLTRAMDIAPRDPAVLITAGDLLMELRQPGEAATYFARAHAIAPRADVAIRECRARVAADAADPCALLDAWLAAHPADVPGRLFRASLHQGRGEKALAIAGYEKVLAAEPRQPVALNNLAWLYHETGDGRALATAGRALEAQPDSASVMDTVGWIEAMEGDRRRGLDLLAAAARLAPRDPEIHYHLAFALAESGERALARQTLAPVLAAAAPFGSRPQAEQLMRRLESGGEGPDG